MSQILCQDCEEYRASFRPDGRCFPCYVKAWHDGLLDADEYDRVCDECPEPIKAAGKCSRHYQRANKHTPRDDRKAPDAVQAELDRLEKDFQAYLSYDEQLDRK